MMPELLHGVSNHLWQSTLFAGAAAVLALALRQNHARARYWLWMAASIKFLVPFSLLVGVGSLLGPFAAPSPTQSAVSLVIEGLTQPLASTALHVSGPLAAPAARPILPALLFAIWLGGGLAVLASWLIRWRRVVPVMRGGVPLTEGREVEALRRLERIGGIRKPVSLIASSARLEPGVFGLLRPVLLWPLGISEHLSDQQLEAILAHELCHIRRRDNLAAALHMLVEAVFWFHPLVWWLGARLVDERESACDEEVLRLGSEPDVYAESILKTCQYYLESPLACMAGVTGSDLKKRIERIMTHPISQGLDFSRKALLAAAGAAAIAGPIILGIFNAPPSHAQSPSPEPPAPAFEVASIKPNNGGDRRVMFMIAPGGRFNATNVTVKMLLAQAFGVKEFQVSGGPGWLDSDHFDISAKAATEEKVQINEAQLKLMMKALLEDRFKLTYHKDSKEMPVYALTVAKNGPKLEPAKGGDAMPEPPRELPKPEDMAKGKLPNRGLWMMGMGNLSGQSVNLQMLAEVLSRQLGRIVLDKTGLTGNYDFKLHWTPDENESGMFRGPGGPGGGKLGGDGPPPPDPNGPSLFTALQEQLGLKLDSQKGPIEIIVIDRIEKPSEN
jgi:uncharacterized protein (TIGR03435 family)